MSHYMFARLFACHVPHVKFANVMVAQDAISKMGFGIKMKWRGTWQNLIKQETVNEMLRICIFAIFFFFCESNFPNGFTLTSQNVLHQGKDNEQHNTCHFLFLFPQEFKTFFLICGSQKIDCLLYYTQSKVFDKIIAAVVFQAQSTF